MSLMKTVIHGLILSSLFVHFSTYISASGKGLVVAECVRVGTTRCLIGPTIAMNFLLLEGRRTASFSSVRRGQDMIHYLSDLIFNLYLNHRSISHQCLSCIPDKRKQKWIDSLPSSKYNVSVVFYQCITVIFRIF